MTKSSVFPRHTKADLPVVARGKGVYLFDTDGKDYFDGSGGAAVSCLGHGDVDVIAATKKQLDTMAYAHTSFFTSEPAERLATRLIECAPPGMGRVYFVSGGSEAVEAALKLSRQYFVEIGQPERKHIISRRQSYHGNTLGALAAGGNLWRRQQFEPLLVSATHIAPCYAYRDQNPNESESDYGLRVANELETAIQTLGETSVMAFIAEPVVGATLGAVSAVPGYFKRVREICDKYGVLLILDEVMCGMGRTGTLFASEQEGIAPDITLIAKGLGAGYQPIGAMLCTQTIYSAIEQGSGLFQHGHTYLGHATACAAADVVLTKLVDGGLVDRCRLLGNELDAKLKAAFADHPHVGDIRGRGLFRGIEFVADRDSKAPFEPALGMHKVIKRACVEAGLICYPMGGTIDGEQGDHVLLAPPFIMDSDDVDELVARLGQALKTIW